MLSLVLSLIFSAAPASAQTFDSATTHRIQQIVSVFENATETIDYGYVENIDDGRGYTAGEAGFCSGTGDMVQVIEDYVHRKPSAAWSKLLPRLHQVSDEESGDVSGLEKLPALWKKSARDKDFILSQEAITDKLYRAPARNALAKYGFKTALAYLIFYDAMIQHGNGDDPDSFSGIIKKMKSHPKGEAKFLSAFLDARQGILEHASDPDTRDAWADSVDRVNALRKLLDAGQWALKPPFSVDVWWQSYSF